MGQIITSDKVKDTVELNKKANKKIVLVGGCFDILHSGHIKFLQSAKSLGDILIVALESDEKVRNLKGNNRPFQKQRQRAETLAELKSVDSVLMLPLMSSDKDYAQLVNIINPDVIAVTEGDKYLIQKQTYANNVGASLEVIPKIRTHSTSTLAKLLGLD